MNAPARNAYAAYRKNEVAGLSPVEIVCRLYRKLHSKLQATREAIQEGKIAAKGESLSRALAIIAELQASLNLEEGGEIAANLNDLYTFLTMELSVVVLKSDLGKLAKAITIVETLVEAWEEIAAAKQHGNVVATRPEAGLQQSVNASY